MSRSPLEEPIITLTINGFGKYVELVFNLDTLGSDHWKDHKVWKVIAFVAARKKDGYHIVARHNHPTPSWPVSLLWGTL
jgi:hypothetical protein